MRAGVEAEQINTEGRVSDLFGSEPRSLKGHGYARRPGAGPSGETCGTCQHFQRGSRGYHKCGHELGKRSCGSATDILVTAPACELWKADEKLAAAVTVAAATEP